MIQEFSGILLISSLLLCVQSQYGPYGADSYGPGSFVEPLGPVGYGRPFRHHHHHRLGYGGLGGPYGSPLGGPGGPYGSPIGPRGYGPLGGYQYEEFRRREQARGALRGAIIGGILGGLGG